MPPLKQLSCSVKWTGSGVPLQEYNTVYGDGIVESYLAVTDALEPFYIQLTSKGYISEGLAMFVYIDGEYQCNRNRLNLKFPNSGSSRKHTEINFQVRQKEIAIADGSIHGQEWRFEKLDIVPDRLFNLNRVSAEDAEYMGIIEVVVRRCTSYTVLRSLNLSEKSRIRASAKERRKKSTFGNALDTGQLLAPALTLVTGGFTDGAYDADHRYPLDIGLGGDGPFDETSTRPIQENRKWGFEMADSKSGVYKCMGLKKEQDDFATKSQQSVREWLPPVAGSEVRTEDSWMTRKTPYQSVDRAESTSAIGHNISNTLFGNSTKHITSLQQSRAMTTAESLKSAAMRMFPDWKLLDNDIIDSDTTKYCNFDKPWDTSGQEQYKEAEFALGQGQAGDHDWTQLTWKDPRNIPSRIPESGDPVCIPALASSGTNIVNENDDVGRGNEIGDRPNKTLFGDAEPEMTLPPVTPVPVSPGTADSIRMPTSDATKAPITWKSKWRKPKEPPPLPSPTASNREHIPGAWEFAEPEPLVGIQTWLMQHTDESSDSVVDNTSQAQLKSPPFLKATHTVQPCARSAQVPSGEKSTSEAMGHKFHFAQANPAVRMKPYWVHSTQDCAGPDLGKSPFLNVRAKASESTTYSILKGVTRRNECISHHVQKGKPIAYAHKLDTPKYIDSEVKPFAVFVFKYRSQAVLEKLLKIKIFEPAETERHHLQSLSKDELIDQLLQPNSSNPGPLSLRQDPLIKCARTSKSSYDIRSLQSNKAANGYSGLEYTETHAGPAPLWPNMERQSYIAAGGDDKIHANVRGSSKGLQQISTIDSSHMGPRLSISRNSGSANNGAVDEVGNVAKTRGTEEYLAVKEAEPTNKDAEKNWEGPLSAWDAIQSYADVPVDTVTSDFKRMDTGEATGEQGGDKMKPYGLQSAAQDEEGIEW